jgi:hypothetical protein
MIRVQAHLIASKKDTPVYRLPSTDEAIIAFVPEGSWLGVIEEKEDWIHIIGIAAEGWVRKADVKSLPPMGLHVVWTPGHPIEYKHFSQAS